MDVGTGPRGVRDRIGSAQSRVLDRWRVETPDFIGDNCPRAQIKRGFLWIGLQARFIFLALFGKSKYYPYRQSRLFARENVLPV
jgi:hypothetical protein